MKLGVLDLRCAIEESVDLAPIADQLGYYRYWFAEHQPQPSPLLYATLAAGITERIRVGTAGILFHYYPPLRTAHNFHFAERVFEGRIDAGFCAGLTPEIELIEDDLDGRNMPAVISQYRERVEIFVGHLRNLDYSGEKSTTWQGAPEAPPQIFYLGGSPMTGEHAGALGLNFAYAYMFPFSKDDPAGIEAYRESFVPAQDGDEPCAILSVTTVCAETMAKAKEIAKLSEGKFFTPYVVGDGPACADQLRALKERYGADELVVGDLCPDYESRETHVRELAKALL